MTIAHGARAAILITIIAAPAYGIRGTIVGIPVTVTELCVALSAVLTVYAVLRTTTPASPRRYIAGYQGVGIGGLFLLAGVILGTIIGGDLRMGLGILKGWILTPMVFFITLSVAYHYAIINGRDVLRALVVSGALLSIISLLPSPDAITYDHRLRGIFSSPNYLGLFLAPLLPLALYSARYCTSHHQKRWVVRWFPLLSAGVIALVLLWTKSISAILVSAIGAALIYTHRMTIPALVRIAGIVGSVIVCCMILWWNTPRIQDFLTHPERSSLASRQMIYISALSMVRDHPLIGIGPGRFQDVYLEYQTRFPPYLEWAVPQPHNILLAFHLNSGVLGVLGLLIVIVTVLTQRTPTPLHRAANIALLVILLHGISDTPYWKNDLSLITWTLLFLSLHRQETVTTCASTTTGGTRPGSPK